VDWTEKADVPWNAVKGAGLRTLVNASSAPEPESVHVVCQMGQTIQALNLLALPIQCGLLAPSDLAS